jgi:hypothetical protein
MKAIKKNSVFTSGSLTKLSLVEQTLLTVFFSQKIDIKDFGLLSSIVLYVFRMSTLNALIIRFFYWKVSQKKEYYVFLFFDKLFCCLF